MRVQNVELPEESHLAELYSVTLEDGDIGDASPAVQELVRTLIPGANALTMRHFTRSVRKAYACRPG